MENMTIIDGIEGLKSFLGRDLGTSEWRTMRSEDIQRFADATGDRQWIHVDSERCQRESPFGVPVAHGYFALALIGGLFFEIVEVRGFKLLINCGASKVSFPAPLKAGTRYRLNVKLTEVRDIPNGVQASVLATLEMFGEAKPACAARLLYRMLLD
jgi:acyl dehydratase